MIECAFAWIDWESSCQDANACLDARIHLPGYFQDTIHYSDTWSVWIWMHSMSPCVCSTGQFECPFGRAERPEETGLVAAAETGLVAGCATCSTPREPIWSQYGTPYGAQGKIYGNDRQNLHQNPKIGENYMIWGLGSSRRVQNTPMGCGNNLLTLCFRFGNVGTTTNLLLQITHWFPAEAMSCMFGPKCYCQTDGMDHGIILCFQRGESRVASETLPNACPGLMFHISSWCVIDWFPFKWVAIVYVSWNTIFRSSGLLIGWALVKKRQGPGKGTLFASPSPPQQEQLWAIPAINNNSNNNGRTCHPDSRSCLD